MGIHLNEKNYWHAVLGLFILCGNVSAAAMEIDQDATLTQLTNEDLIAAIYQRGGYPTEAQKSEILARADNLRGCEINILDPNPDESFALEILQWAAQIKAYHEDE